MRYLKTAEVAKATGIHPNTVRLYEEWHFLPEIPRGLNGYRQFTLFHVDQIRLTRLILKCTFLSGVIRSTALSVIYTSASGELSKAMEGAEALCGMLEAERSQAEAALEVLENWVYGSRDEKDGKVFQINEVTKLLNVSSDMLRNWERNGLVSVPRNPDNGYRMYGTAEMKRLRVIRALRRARYSTMSILRMLNYLEKGETCNLRQVLDTPVPDEDIVYFTDKWLSTLTELEKYMSKAINLLKEMIWKYGDSKKNTT